jgi:hypothetical protein
MAFRWTYAPTRTTNKTLLNHCHLAAIFALNLLLGPCLPRIFQNVHTGAGAINEVEAAVLIGSDVV